MFQNAQAYDLTRLYGAIWPAGGIVGQLVTTMDTAACPQDFNIKTASECNHAPQTSRNIRRVARVRRCAVSIIGWIILGLVFGFIASKIVNKTGQGFFLDLVLGIVAAIVGGVIFSALGASGITGLNLYSMVVAVIGAVVVLVIYHMVSGRRAF
jgi:uncharacterized membrane protein YeaQ/YmgE (transglycosylase-associated protein family)